MLPYLADLGISHLYLSPILQASPGSTHGYDVVDHDTISEELGGESKFRALAAAAKDAGLGIIVDVVPNHMAVPVPAYANRALWSVLRDGPSSPYARWFDVGWAAQQQAILMPVLGSRIGESLAAREITFDDEGDEPVLRYYDQVFPVRPGTEDLTLPELVDRQWYRLAHWRVGHEELNYRRFFDVDGLVAVRVEDPEVFEATHRVLLRLFEEELVDGFRIDHPDGLADPRGYLRRLSEAAPGAWIVVEKILEGLEPAAETLPADWPCAGTTGYETLNRALGLQVDPAGAAAFDLEWTQHRDTSDGEPRRTGYDEVVEQAKRDVIDGSLRAEVTRLASLATEICNEDLMLRDHTQRALRHALEEMLIAFPVYRAYVVPGEDPPETSVRLLEEVVQDVRGRRPELSDEVSVLRDLALYRKGRPGDHRRDEFCIRFQQTCGPVMAKGIEDTASYRWLRLVALNEVGGAPDHFGMLPDSAHVWFAAQQRRHPYGMTTLSTHDTKRSEDTRARIAALSELPEEWHEAVKTWSGMAAKYHGARGPDPATEYLIWQTLVGTLPIGEHRLRAYLTKAMREAKRHTSWTSVNQAYEDDVLGFAANVLTDQSLAESISGFVARLDRVADVNVLSQKLLQLTAPGVPDIYQGCETVDRSLVDPDNRRPVDYSANAFLLAGAASHSSLSAAKLWVTASALRLRREHPDWFGEAAGYRPVASTTTHAFGFRRGERVITLLTRRSASLERLGGWGDAAVVLPDGAWRDKLTDRTFDGGEVAAGEVFAELPVALLVADQE